MYRAFPLGAGGLCGSTVDSPPDDNRDGFVDGIDYAMFNTDFVNEC